MIPILLKILRTGVVTEPAPRPREEWRVRASEINAQILQLLGRALVIREVDTGSCNACELEVNALSNSYYNIEGLGIKLAASPRHADMLLVTGPVTKNMEQALRIAYEQMPAPKLVVALGDCGRDGGIFGASYATCGGVSKVLPVDVVVPGCPPPPIAILEGILAAVAKRAA
jgi:Ni,Fe-hydrogenase III small subunit